VGTLGIFHQVYPGIFANMWGVFNSLNSVQAGFLMHVQSAWLATTLNKFRYRPTLACSQHHPRLANRLRVVMMAALGGRERTEGELRTLVTQSGFELDVVPSSPTFTASVGQAESSGLTGSAIGVNSPTPGTLCNRYR
jgi:hypothetical protein